MCGICGVFDYRNGGAVDRALLERMTATLAHRGPDGAGFLVRPGVGLGMRRLSVIDLETGAQPIANEDNTCWIVFNGEIYNYRQLAEALRRKGHILRTRSDTEVILHLYEDHGPDCVAQLDGMFAFAIYDERPDPPGRPQGGRRLVLGRDRLGKKPLYCADVAGRLIFGSEMKPVLVHPDVGKTLDTSALTHYLAMQMVPAPFSILRDVRKLPAGQVMIVDAEGPRTRRYWNYRDFVAEREVPDRECAKAVRALVFSAVEKRLVSDVPIGAFLSGGLDSSVVVAVMSRLVPEKVKTFSIGFDGPADFDELEHARALARHCGTEHHEFVARQDTLALVPQVVRTADEPFAIASAIPLLLLSRAAREHVTVVLTGDGGDEVFGGYTHYLYERWAAQYRRVPGFVDGLIEHARAGLNRLGPRGSPNPPGDRLARLAAHSRGGLARRRLGLRGGFLAGDIAQLLPEGGGPGACPAGTTESFLTDLLGPDASLAPETLDNILDFQVFLPDEMLAKVDRMTMGASLEGRCPLLDVALVEYMAGLSFRTKVPGCRQRDLKHIVRVAVGDLLPESLLNRPKHGFDVPLDAWFERAGDPYIDSVLNPGRVRARGVFDPAAVSDLLARHRRREIRAGTRLFSLLVFEEWAEATL